MTIARRRGVALFAALALITLVALLVGGALASSSMAQRASVVSQSDALLTASADYAINSVLGDANGLGLADLPLGRDTSYGVTVPGVEGVTAVVAATRLPAGVLWLVANVQLSGRDQGNRRVNVVARWQPIGPELRAPIMSRGAVRFGAGVSFSPDTSTDADCSLSSAADVITPPGVSVTSADSIRAAVEPTASDSTLYYVSARQRSVLDSAIGVVHVRGDTTIAGGTLDGVLMVDGALTITGPFSAFGLIIARGPVLVTGGLSLTGAVLSFAAPPVGHYSIDLATTTIRFSPCAIERAIRRAKTPRPVRQRSWTELF